MKKAEKGQKVKVHYTGKLEDGTTFDTSVGKTPLEFTIGEGQLIPGFEKGVIGLKEGESTEINIPAEEGYGEIQEQLVGKIPKEKLPENLEPKVGMRLQSQTPDGQTFVVKVVDISEDDITIDGNHELAGKDLVFEVELVEILS
jgi:FKBP-type peptidyl-prolyl cis-trans isomerase 2